MLSEISEKSKFAPGTRIQSLDAEWLVRCIDKTSTNGEQLTCIGISQLVKDKEAIFLTEIEPIEVLKSEETQLVNVQSSSFGASLL